MFFFSVPILLVTVLMLTCQPPLFIKSDFDQNYVYGTPEAATLTTILLLSIICKWFLEYYIHSMFITYIFFRYGCLFSFAPTLKA